MEQTHPQPSGMLGGQSSTVPDPAHAAALTLPRTPCSMQLCTQPTRTYLQPHYRKKRTASADTLAQFEQAEAMRELVLIFDTSKGKRGAYGGLGHDTREAQEKTIGCIIGATVPGLQFEQKRIDQIDVYEDKPTSSSSPQALRPTRLSGHNLKCTRRSHITSKWTYGYGRTALRCLHRGHHAGPCLTSQDVWRPHEQIPISGGTTTGYPDHGVPPRYAPEHPPYPAVLEWLTEDITDDLKAVLIHPLQPKQGFTIQVAPNQPSRLAPRNNTTGTTGLGFSIKFCLIAPPPLDPRDIESVTGVLLPTPLLMPRCYTKTPGTNQYAAKWDYDPEDPDTQKLTRAERCCGGPRGMGDSVTVRYIAPTYSSGTLLATST